MKYPRKIFAIVFIFLCLVSCIERNANSPSIDTGEMIVRIAEIEIEAEYLNDYLAVLQEESEASVRLEPGVICIYPMYEKENPTEIRLLEIYASKKAYESHLQTPHFQKYKTSTAHMVKSLELVDMEAIDPESSAEIFKKLNR